MLLNTAGKYLGVTELPGSRHHPQIVRWLRDHGKNLGEWGKSRDETAWCAVFVSAVLAELGYQGTDHALARSYITWGQPAKFEPGAIVVIRHKTARADGTYGLGGFHVGFFKRMTKNHIWLRGGNQRNSVSDVAFAKKNIEVIALRKPAY